MTRGTMAIVTAVAATVLLSVVAMPVAAHANTIEATTQVSPDGTVLAESVFVFEDAWLVVHRDDGGDVGEPIGHTAVSPSDLKTEFPVEIDSDVWSAWDGPRAVHLALHHDDGDGEFDPADDPILSTDATTAATRIVVEKGDQRAYVHAARIEALETDGDVTVREAALPSDGFLVAHPAGAPDQVVATTPLDAGVHESVTLSMDEQFYVQQPRRFDLSITVYRDDGDGAFGDGDDPLRVGDEPVSTTVTLERTDDRTPTGTTAADEDDGHNDGDDGHDHDDENGSHTHEDGHDDESTPTPTAGTDGAGPGPILALVAVLAAAVIARRQTA